MFCLEFALSYLGFLFFRIREFSEYSPTKSTSASVFNFLTKKCGIKLKRLHLRKGSYARRQPTVVVIYNRHSIIINSKITG